MPTNEQIDKLLRDRYYLPTETSWSDVVNRVSKIYEPIKPFMLQKEFIPSSPTLMNANTNGVRAGTLSSCFPVKIEDSLKGIMKTMNDVAEITRMGGGVGMDFSSLRGSNEMVSGNSRASGGPLSFIGIYDAILDGIMQGGARRGAGMSMLDIHHPSILDFIKAKQDTNKYMRSNFSVRMPDSFYKTLKEKPNEIFKTINVVDKKENILCDENDEPFTYQRLWDLIIESAWMSAEPGVFNKDIATKKCTVTNVDQRVLSNPCAEFVNIPYSSCNLGSIDLAKLVEDGKINHDKFVSIIQNATKFLNNVIDANAYPIPEIEDITKKIRAIGLGFMGLGHALMKMGICYDSKEGNDVVKYICKIMLLESMKVSIELAKEFGPYPAFDFETYKQSKSYLWEDQEFAELLSIIKKVGIRNSANLSCAPTGSLSFLANTSSGIEPIFALAYTRRIEKTNKEYEEVYVTDDVFEAFIDDNYKEHKEEILKDVVNNKGSCQKCKVMSKEHKDIFKTANDISANDHLEILSSAANIIDLSVSKTINLPRDISKEEVADVYLKAWEKGIIGVTVYREGSRDGILVTNTEEKTIEAGKHAPKRPQDIECEVNITSIKKKQYYVVLGLLEGKPYEVFTGENYNNEGDIFIPRTIKQGIIRKKKSRKYLLLGENEVEYDISNGHSSEEADALSRQISLNLRHGTPLQYVVEQLQKYQGLHNFPKAIARTLKKFIDNNTISTEKCPECKTQLIYTDGCVSCPACGFSKCG